MKVIYRQEKGLDKLYNFFVLIMGVDQFSIGSLICKQSGSRSDCSLRSSQIRVLSVWVHDKSSLVHLNTCICNRGKKHIFTG